MSDLVGNPDDRFSRVAAQIVLICRLICVLLFVSKAKSIQQYFTQLFIYANSCFEIECMQENKL